MYCDSKEHFDKFMHKDAIDTLVGILLTALACLGEQFPLVLQGG